MDTISRATLCHVSTSHGLIGVPTLSYEDRYHSEENCAVQWQSQQGHGYNEITRFPRFRVLGSHQPHTFLNFARR